MNNFLTDPVNAYFLSVNSKTTIDSCKFRLMCFCKFTFGSRIFSDCDWSKLSYVDVLKFIQHQSSLGLAYSSINVTLSTIKSVSLHAWQLGFISIDEHMRIKNIKNLRGLTADTGRALSIDEIDHIKKFFNSQNDHVARRNYAMFALACGAGLRRRELMLLNVEDISKDRILVKGKGNKIRTVYLSDFVINALKRWQRVHRVKSGALFVRVFADNSKGERLSILSIHRAMERTVKLSGCKPFTTHDLRRTFATTLLCYGADKFSVQRLMGHSSLNTTTRYDKRGDKPLIDAVSLLPF